MIEIGAAPAEQWASSLAVLAVLAVLDRERIKQASLNRQLLHFVARADRKRNCLRCSAFFRPRTLHKIEMNERTCPMSVWT